MQYAQLVADGLPSVVQKAMLIYMFLIILGLGLMLIVLIGTVFVRERKNN